MKPLLYKSGNRDKNKIGRFGAGRVRRDMHKLFYGLLVLNFGLMVLSLQGCANGGYDGPLFNCYLTDEVPLLEKGPSQETPAEEKLSAGTRVRIINGGGAFTLVETVSGKQGWVPTSSIKMQEESGPTGAGGGGNFGAHTGW